MIAPSILSTLLDNLLLLLLNSLCAVNVAWQHLPWWSHHGLAPPEAQGQALQLLRVLIRGKGRVSSGINSTVLKLSSPQAHFAIHTPSVVWHNGCEIFGRVRTTARFSSVRHFLSQSISCFLAEQEDPSQANPTAQHRVSSSFLSAATRWEVL